jgi:hypothetical protein
MVVAIIIATVIATVIVMNVVTVQSVTIKPHRLSVRSKTKVNVHNVTKNHVNQDHNSNQDLSQWHKMAKSKVHNPHKVSKMLNSVSHAKAAIVEAVMVVVTVVLVKSVQLAIVHLLKMNKSSM